MFVRILFGLLIAAVGAAITIKSEAIFRNFGPLPFAEKYLHTEGGSRLGYQVVGILVSVVGFLILTGLIENVLRSLAGLLVPGSSR